MILKVNIYIKSSNYNSEIWFSFAAKWNDKVEEKEYNYVNICLEI